MPGCGGRLIIDEASTMDKKIREILDGLGCLSKSAATFSLDQDLYALGLSSLATVNLMLALENNFDVEFPDSALSRKTFGSIGALKDMLSNLQAGIAA